MDSGTIVFHEMDEEYNGWRDRHREGWVLNDRRPSNDPILHRTTCWRIDKWKPEWGAPTRNAKVCGLTREAVERWAEERGVEIERCSTCD